MHQRTPVLLLLALFACAGPQKRPLPVLVPGLPRSSIAAVLRHADAVGLTPEQTVALARRDERLAHERQQLLGRRPSAAHPSPAGGADAHGERDGGGDRGAWSGSPDGGGLAGGPGGGGGGGGGRGGMGPPGGAGRRGGPGGGAARGAVATEDVIARFDAADTRAYLAAEAEVLTPEQRERAREVASDYRATLDEQRRALRDAPPAPRPHREGDDRGPPPPEPRDARARAPDGGPPAPR